MTRFAAFLAVAITSLAIASDKGVCPAEPPAPVTLYPTGPAVSSPDKKYAGTVMLLVTISDAGHVCSTSVVRGMTKEINQSAQKRVAGWRFEPAKKDGKAVPAAVRLDIKYWIDASGKMVSDPAPPGVNTGGKVSPAKSP